MKMDENKRDARLDFFKISDYVDTTVILRDTIRYGANRSIYLEANKEKQISCACDEIVTLLSKVNRILRNELISILDVCTTDVFEEELKEIMDGVNSLDLYTSPDFQCEQTGGFPTSLQVCWEKNKACQKVNLLL